MRRESPFSSQTRPPYTASWLCVTKTRVLTTNQVFLVDGDSLLHEIALDPLLDWTHGGQQLHIMYALEQYIRRFQEGGRVFRFVFFHSAGSVMWNRAPLLQLVRDTCIAHLRHRLGVVVNEFHNWTDKAFHEFLERVDPAFIIVGDGSGGGDASSSSSSSSSSSTGNAAKPQVDTVSSLNNYFDQLSLNAPTPVAAGLSPHEVIRSLTLYLLSHHQRVIRLTEISFASNCMYGFQLGHGARIQEAAEIGGRLRAEPRAAGSRCFLVILVGSVGRSSR